ncbi:MAG TPA: hypothetical protein DC047_19065 [Blastocatellia bacterium]|nr:hypothetical protein [Blastocatellia bacterium]
MIKSKCARVFFKASENKTHKKLILKKHSRITLPVARVTAFETNQGTATDVVTHGRAERQAAVNPIDALG